LIAGCLVKGDILTVFGQGQARDENTKNQEDAV